MSRVTVADGIEIEYDTIGSPDDEPLVLVSGLGTQLIVWRDEFCELLAAGGRYVIRFDNRDAGLSTTFTDDVDVLGVIGAAMAGLPTPAVPYRLTDMADDAFGLLDHLGIERAHIVGGSMGGMIAQTMAIKQPQRCLSLVSIMSQPGEADVGQPTPEALEVLLTPASDRDGFIDGAVRSRVWSSKKYFDPHRIRLEAARAFDRSFVPQGTMRQLAAIFASGSRSEHLATLEVPTLVIHGRDDALITPSGGIRTAELIPGANLLLMADMGHDLPEPLWPILTDAIVSHTRAASMAST